MDQETKDWLQAAAWIAAAVGLIVTAMKFWSEFRQGRLQRERDFRWRQAEAGKGLNDEMQTDLLAWPAMQMLDYGHREFKLPSERVVSITHSDLATALDPSIECADEKCIYIRDCFDNFFYYMAMMDHYISSTLVREDDVAYPMEYYVPKLTKFRPQVVAYLEKFRMWRTRKFLERYAEWNSPTTIESEPTSVEGRNQITNELS